MEQGGFFAADEGAGAEGDLDVEIKVGAHDVLAEQTIFSRLLDGVFEAVDGEWIFGADVDAPFVCADGIAADGHGFEHGMWVAFEDGAVHERAWVPFVGVADDIFHVGVIAGSDLPFLPGWEAGAAAAAQSGIKHFLDDVGWCHFKKALTECHVSVVGNAVVDVARINDAAVSEGNTQLLNRLFRFHSVTSSFTHSRDRFRCVRQQVPVS